MKQPPRQLKGSDEFYRALRPEWIKDNGKISPGAFCNAKGTDRMSVDWVDMTTFQEALDRWAQWGDDRGLASITADLSWDNGQKVEYTPTEDNPAHSDVVGDKQPSVRKRLAKGAKLVMPV